MSLYREGGKRALDAVVSIAGLTVLSPVLALTAVSVALALGRPVIFRQERPGRGGRLFPMRKFRTMSDARDADGRLLPDEERLGHFGRLLRATSLDELPELWNVLAGEMSLVGPRPLLVEYLPLYSDRQARRHDVRPGITGLAQVSGRNDLPWEEKFELDLEYVENCSLLLDLKILVRTVRRVLTGSGVGFSDLAERSRFNGSSPDRVSTDTRSSWKERSEAEP